MQIDKLPGLEPGQASLLASAGILSCSQLLRASRRRDGFSHLAETTQLAPEALQSLIQRSELCQVRGIGPSTLAVLCEIGVDSIYILAEQEPSDLHGHLCPKIDRPPNLAVIEDWIFQAQRCARRSNVARQHA